MSEKPCPCRPCTIRRLRADTSLYDTETWGPPRDEEWVRDHSRDPNSGWPEGGLPHGEHPYDYGFEAENSQEDPHA